MHNWKKKMKKTLGRLLALSCAGVMLLSGCSAPQESAPPAFTDPGSPQYGGTLRLAFGVAQSDSDLYPPTTANQNVLRSAFLKNKDIKQEKLLCDYWLEDGSFLKIDAISLGYTINMKKWQKYIDAIDLYLTVRNVACLTGYSGLNPEVNINGLDPGYEWYNDLYPETRRYTFGVKLTF